MTAPRRPKILFLCGRNQWRSPTAEALYRNDPRVEVRSAGLSPEARRRVTARDLAWADLVLTMERSHARERESPNRSDHAPGRAQDRGRP